MKNYDFNKIDKMIQPLMTMMQMAIGVLINKDTLYFDSYCSYDITHWMPLPQPPLDNN